MKKKILAVLLCVVMVAALFMGCTANEDSASNDAANASTAAGNASNDTENASTDSRYDFKIGYTTLGNTTNFFVDVNEGLEAAAIAKGVEIDWTVDDRDAAKMKSAIDAYVTQGADIIVDFSVLAESGSAIAAELAKQGIPMLSVDCAYEGAYFFGVDNASAGTSLGEFAVEWVETNWNGEIDSVSILYNEASGEVVYQRVGNAAEVLLSEGLASEDMITKTNANPSGAATLDVATLRSMVVDYLTAHPDDDHIVMLCATDELACAAEAAILSSGRTDDVRIFSHGCDVAVIDKMQDKEGCIVASVNYNSKGYGEQIVEACADILAAKAEGRDPGQNFYNKVYIVSQENVWDYYTEKVEG